LGSGLEPEKYPNHFSEVKDRIVNDKGDKKSDKSDKPVKASKTTKAKASKKKGESK
jgi:hypothetical protein